MQRFILGLLAASAQLAAAAGGIPLNLLPAAPHAGYLAVAPITPPVGTGTIRYVLPADTDPSYASDAALLPAGETIASANVYVGSPALAGAANSTADPLQTAATATVPGDTVEAFTGTYVITAQSYNNAVLSISNSGTASNYITYEAFPGQRPIITIAGNYNVFYDVMITANYIVFKGFQVVGTAMGVTLPYANAYSTTAIAAIQTLPLAASSGLVTLPQGVADSYGGSAKRATNSTCISGDGSATSPVNHLYFLNNIIHDCAAAGIDIEYGDYLTTEANTIYATSWYTMYDTSGISYHFADNSDTSTAYKNFVLDNVSEGNSNTQLFDLDVWNNAKSAGSASTTPTDGNGIIIDTNQTTNDGNPYLGRTLVAGNIVYNNGGSGIHAYLSSHVDIVYNTAYLNDNCQVSGSTCGARTSGNIYCKGATDCEIFDNIMYALPGLPPTTSISNTTATEGNNVEFNQGGTAVSAGFTQAGTDKFVDPVFARPLYPFISNFSLSSGSPAINAGTAFINDGLNVATLLGLTVNSSGQVNAGAQP